MLFDSFHPFDLELIDMNVIFNFYEAHFISLSLHQGILNKQFHTISIYSSQCAYKFRRRHLKDFTLLFSIILVASGHP